MGCLVEAPKSCKCGFHRVTPVVLTMHLSTVSKLFQLGEAAILKLCFYISPTQRFS